MVVRADLTYSQGINRMWSRKTRFEGLSNLRDIKAGMAATEIFGTLQTRIRRDNTKLCFNNCLPWPQKGTASFIADTGNLAVESVPQYPFGHTIKVVADSGFHHETNR
jgi:hypothetical protein